MLTLGLWDQSRVLGPQGGLQVSSYLPTHVGYQPYRAGSLRELGFPPFYPKTLFLFITLFLRGCVAICLLDLH